MRNLTVNGERLWASLMELAEIGATPKGGVCRLAASDLDGQARRLFIGWCEDAGCTIRVDKIGNIFARRPGRDASLPPVVTGSHLDTQPTGRARGSAQLERSRLRDRGADRDRRLDQ